MSRTPARDVLLAKGPRVRLVRPGRASAKEVLAANRASRRYHAPYVKAPGTPAEYRAYLKRFEAGRHVGMLARRLEDDALVGFVNLNEIVGGGFHSAYMGYYGYKETAGQGLMQEALSLGVAHAFGPLKLHRVEANIQPENRRSIDLVDRLGFQLEGYSPRYLKVGGRWRDHERWALTKEDWRALRKAR